MNVFSTYEPLLVPDKIVRKYFEKSYNTTAYPKNIYKISSTELKGRNVSKFVEGKLSQYKSVLLPNGVIYVEKEGIKIPSNSTLYFSNRTLLKYSGPALGRLSDIIKIYDVQNVKIINARIQGSRDVKNQTGEWSAGICILNSNNVLVENAHIFDTWGDGVFIGSENDGVSRNITLRNIWIDKARRNAISITSVIGASINMVLLSNTHGTLPECGVDIEPSLFGEYLQDIVFEDLFSFNNKNAAFNINLSALNSDVKQYAPEVTIRLNKIYDAHSNGFIGLGFNNFNKKYTPRGNVSISNGFTENANHDVELDLSKIKTKINFNGRELKKQN